LGAMLFGLAAIVSTLTAISPRTSLQGTPESFGGLGVVLAYLTVFFATRGMLASMAGIRALAVAASVATAGAAVYALLQVARLEPMAWDDASHVAGFVRPFGTFGHPILLGGYLAMALPLLLYLIRLAISAGERGRLAILSVVTMLAIAGVIATLSRAAWLAAICGIAVFAIPRVWTRRWLAVGAMVTLAVVAALAASGADFGSALLVRLQRPGDGGGRYQIWRTAWLLFKDHPWLGSGLDTFQLVFSSRQTPDYWHIEWGRTPAKAHNEVLHTLATQGLLGFAALVAWGTGLLVATVRAWRRCPRGDRLALAAVIGSLVAFLVQVQLGFVEPGCGTLAACLAGLLAGLGSGREEATVAEPPAWPIPLGAGLAAAIFAANVLAGLEAVGPKHLLAIGIFGSIVTVAAFALASVRPAVPTRPALSRGRTAAGLWPDRAVRTVWAAAAAATAGFGLVEPYRADCASQSGAVLREVDPQASLAWHRSAVTLAPGYALYWTRLAAVAKELADQESSAGRRRWLEVARDAVDRATVLVPADPANHANRGRILAALTATGEGNGDAALAEFDVAIALAPYNLVFRADAGQAALVFRGRPGRRAVLRALHDGLGSRRAPGGTGR